MGYRHSISNALSADKNRYVRRVFSAENSRPLRASPVRVDVLNHFTRRGLQFIIRRTSNRDKRHTEEDVIARVRSARDAIPLKKTTKQAGGTTRTISLLFPLSATDRRGSAFMDFPRAFLTPSLTIRTYLWIYPVRRVVPHTAAYTCRSCAATLNHVQARITYRGKMHRGARSPREKNTSHGNFCGAKLRNTKVARPTLSRHCNVSRRLRGLAGKKAKPKDTNARGARIVRIL